MRHLPFAARVYLIGLWIVALLVFGAHVPALIMHADQVPLLLISLVGYTLADYFEVGFAVGTGEVVMNLADAPAIFLIAVSGMPGMLAVFLGTIISDTLHRRAWFRALFNSTTAMITYVVMVTVLQALQVPGQLPFAGLRGGLTLLAVAVVYYLLNTLLTGTIVALATGQPAIQVYQSSYQSIEWIRFITIPLGAVMATLWFVDRWLLLVAIIPLIMGHRAFAAIAMAQQESRRSRELADERSRLLEELKQQQD